MFNIIKKYWQVILDDKYLSSILPKIQVITYERNKHLHDLLFHIHLEKVSSASPNSTWLLGCHKDPKNVSDVDIVKPVHIYYQLKILPIPKMGRQ